MHVKPYENTGPVDCTTPLDLSTLKDKSVIVTGGSSGLGAAYVKAFAEAGAYVTIADINPNSEKLPESRVQYVKCDVCSWYDQVSVFKAALASSPQNSIDIVVANAGIVGPDPIFALDEGDEPTEPDLRIIKVNFIGVAYTTKLALHYFRKQPEDASRDRCLILKSSLAGYVDVVGSPSYQSSKFGVRGLMSNLRRAGSIRVNAIAPWYIATPIMSETTIKMLNQQLGEAGSGFAEVEDAVKAVMKVASDTTINGRSFAVVPRKIRTDGYLDADYDDFKEDDLLGVLQNQVLHATHRIPAEQL